MTQIVFIIGAVLIAFIVFYMFYVQFSMKRKTRKLERDYSELVKTLPDDDGTVGPVTIKGKQNVDEYIKQPANGGNSFHQASASEQSKDKEQNQPWASWYQFNILARDHKPFTLAQLKEIFAKENLTFGEFDVFYKYDQQSTGKNRDIFRVGNLIKPGSFPQQISLNYSGTEKADDWTTKGICVIMFTPSAKIAENRFVLTLKFVESVNSALDGILCTKDLKPMTQEIISTYRQQLREHDHS